LDASAVSAGPEVSWASSVIPVTEKTMIPAPVGVHVLFVQDACHPKYCEDWMCSLRSPATPFWLVAPWQSTVIDGTP
jgi:hypothetical protein